MHTAAFLEELDVSLVFILSVLTVVPDFAEGPEAGETTDRAFVYAQEVSAVRSVLIYFSALKDLPRSLARHTEPRRNILYCPFAKDICGSKLKLADAAKVTSPILNVEHQDTVAYALCNMQCARIVYYKALRRCKIASIMGILTAVKLLAKQRKLFPPRASDPIFLAYSPKTFEQNHSVVNLS